MASKAFCSLALILLYAEATQAYAPPRLRSVRGGPSLRCRNRVLSVATPEILSDRNLVTHLKGCFHVKPRSSIVAYYSAKIYRFEIAPLCMSASSRNELNRIQRFKKDWEGVFDPFFMALGMKTRVPLNPPPTSGKATLYRQLGVPEDADYDEIEEAFQRLLVKYKGNKKKVVRLEKVRDQINAIQLKERASGLKIGSIAARKVSFMEEKWDKMKKEQMIKEAMSLPPFLRGWVKKPDGEHFRRCSLWILPMVFAALAFDRLNRPISMVSSLLAASLMGNRDMPPLVKDEQGRVVKIVTPSGLSILATIFICMACNIVGGFVGTLFLMRMIGYQNSVTIGSKLFLYLAALYLTTWREGESREAY